MNQKQLKTKLTGTVHELNLRGDMVFKSGVNLEHN